MSTPYELDEPSVNAEPSTDAVERSEVSGSSFLDRARALARANAARPALRVSGARVGEAARPVDTRERRGQPGKRLGLRVHASGRRLAADVDGSGEGVA